MGDRIFRACFDAVTAEDATPVIDVVNLGEAFIDAGTFGWRARVIFRDDINALGWASGSAKKTSNTFLLAILVDMQQMLSAITRLRSEEHTSELQSPCNLVCRLLLEKKKKNIK